MPGLWGGEDGANLTRALMSAGFGSMMLLVSAYSNPVLTLQHAREQGYVVSDFLVQPLPFGTYSSQELVHEHLLAMRARGEAFFRDTGGRSRPYYFLAGVLFEKRTQEQPRGGGGGGGQQQQQQQQQQQVDLTDELLSVMTAL
jgi:hypothetical protein